MNTDSLNKWLTLITNIAVVIGIFALIAELNHSSRLAEVSAFQNRMTEIQESQVQLALSGGLATILEKYQVEGVESLSPSEYIRAQAWYAAGLRRMQGQYFQYQQGFLDRNSIDRTLAVITTRSWGRWIDFELLENVEIPEWRDEIELSLEMEK